MGKVTVTRRNGQVTIRGTRSVLTRLASYASAARSGQTPVTTSTPTEQRLQELARIVGEYWLEERFHRLDTAVTVPAAK